MFESTTNQLRYGLQGKISAEQFVLKIIRTLCNLYQYLNGYILGTYCLEFILSIPIISIQFVIQFILIRPDVSIFVATDKHLRISDKGLFCEFKMGFYSFTKICNFIIKQRAHTKNMEKKMICASDIQL
jgi:hypothetical protein